MHYLCFELYFLLVPCRKERNVLLGPLQLLSQSVLFLLALLALDVFLQGLQPDSRVTKEKDAHKYQHIHPLPLLCVCFHVLHRVRRLVFVVTCVIITV